MSVMINNDYNGWFGQSLQNYFKILLNKFEGEVDPKCRNSPVMHMVTGLKYQGTTTVCAPIKRNKGWVKYQCSSRKAEGLGMLKHGCSSCREVVDWVSVL